MLPSYPLQCGQTGGRDPLRMGKLRPQARKPHRPHVRRLALPKISKHLRLGWRGFYTNVRHTHPLQSPHRVNQAEGEKELGVGASLQESWLCRVGQLRVMRCPGQLKDEWISRLTTAPTPHTHTHTHLLPECLFYLCQKWRPA